MLPYKQLIVTASHLVRRENRGENWEEDDGKCDWVTPGPNGNVPVGACNSYYNYDPQFAPAVAVAVIFGILTAVHVAEAFAFKKRYAWVLIMGALWETIGFIFHSLGAKDQQQMAYAIIWMDFFLLAPLWINAFVYMTFARMVLYWHPEGKIAGLRATAIAKWFVLADILTFIIQGVGGIMANPNSGTEIIKIGLNIYLGGMGAQQFFILIFYGLMYAFWRRCTRAEASSYGHNGKRSWRPLLYSQYGVLLCITVRIIFRLVEFAQGVDPEHNPIPFHEEYIYALDVFPMMVALLILAIWYPGRYLVGPESEFHRLSRREKKEMKREKKAARREEKEAKKQAKQNRKKGSNLMSDDVVP
ncbi:hypothetical protein N657DRAFT_694374 [Parathielavia appendiculata]|uniref:Uncharacterized protein n=1 Tax=Parathielavia appendiculata TaxID=2587402 RepID=A0AAN6YZM9_9PEZI|nr:hypothetical protein N657DRAFT_694374 [Parathielavia appendiculata]